MGVGGTGRVNRSKRQGREGRIAKSNKVQRATNVHAQRTTTGGLAHHSLFEQSAELNRRRARADFEKRHSICVEQNESRFADGTDIGRGLGCKAFFLVFIRERNKTMANTPELDQGVGKARKILPR